jgi:hypothetical protein
MSEKEFNDIEWRLWYMINDLIREQSRITCATHDPDGWRDEEIRKMLKMTFLKSMCEFWVREAAFVNGLDMEKTRDFVVENINYALKCQVENVKEEF